MFAVAAELVETERSYVKSLGTLVELYVRPAASNHILGAARSKRIFQNAEWLLEVNSAFLAALEKACAAEADAQGASGRSGAPRGRVLGALLRRFLARATPLYLEYIQNYGTAVKALDDGARRYGAIRNLLEKVRSDPACGGLRLQSFLIMPVQRLPRYKMLFEEMVKAISKEEAASPTSAQTDRQARPELTSPLRPALRRRRVCCFVGGPGGTGGGRQGDRRGDDSHQRQRARRGEPYQASRFGEQH